MGSTPKADHRGILVPMKQVPPIFALVASPDGSQVAAAGAADGRVRLWGRDGVREVCFAQGKRAADGLAFTPNGRGLLVGSNHLYLLDVKTGATVRTFEDSRGVRGIAGIAVDPTGAVACAAMGPAVRFWDVATGSALRTIDDFGWHVHHLCGSGANVVTYAGESKHTLRVWNLAQGALVRNLVTGIRGGVVGAVTATATWIAAASGSFIEVWPADQAKPRWRLKSKAAPATALAIGADDVLWARDGTSELEAWSLLSGKRIATYDADPTHILPLADGRVLLADEDAGSLEWLKRDVGHARTADASPPATVRHVKVRPPTTGRTKAATATPADVQPILRALRGPAPVPTLDDIARRSRRAFPEAQSPWLLDPRLIPALVRCLRAPGEAIAIAAASALAAITRGVLQPDPRAIPVLTKALAHAHVNVRFFAVCALTNLPHDAFDALSPLLLDRAKKVRLATLRGIAQSPKLPTGLRARALAKDIAPLLADRVAAVRAEAAEVLGRLPTTIAHPSLQAAIASERDPTTKLRMRRALGRS